jgi:Spy/CpxP family protein refolding chaperone
VQANHPKKNKKMVGFDPKNMKKILITAFMALWLAPGLALAQRPDTNYDKEKLESARVAFITNRLDLKPEQAEKFWPLFNKYNDERSQMMEQLSSLNRNSMSETNDAKAKELIQQRFVLQQRLLDKEKQFMDEITKVITPVQAVKLGGVNREFTRQVYRMNQGRRHGGGQPTEK